MISVKEATAIIESQTTSSSNVQKVSLINALGLVAAEDVLAPINMPPFRQAAMDGYAVCGKAQVYTIIGEVKAGDSKNPVLKLGEAVRIFTGAAVPDTAIAVVMQEKTVVTNDTVRIIGTISDQDNIRPLGEQIKKEQTALTRGTRLCAATIGFLATLGLTEITVTAQPKIAIVVTGNELEVPGEVLPYGKIYESNGIMLHSALRSLGYTHVTMLQVNDDYEKTKSMLHGAITTHDFVLISGGISVGDYDFVGKALTALSVVTCFYKVNQKPGKPLFFGKKEAVHVLALPGNPAAALTCFYVYVLKALRLFEGDRDSDLIKVKGLSNAAYEKKGTRAQFLKALISEGSVTILEGQSSAMLESFSEANALVYMPPEMSSIAIDQKVTAMLLPN